MQRLLQPDFAIAPWSLLWHSSSCAYYEREETLLRELRAKLKAAEQAIADAKR